MIVGDKIKLVKKMGVFDNIGEVCEVTDIQEGGVICFKFGGGQHLGCMSYDEYEKYFENVEESVKRKWSEWKYELICFRSLHDNNIVFGGMYRTNGKKVEFKVCFTKNEVIKTSASCCRYDEFNIKKGLDLAKKRFIVKYLDQQVKDIAKEM